MIRNYELLDGGRIAASSPEEFVRLLREGSLFDFDCTDAEFMMNFATRYNEVHGGDCHRYTRAFRGRFTKKRLYKIIVDFSFRSF